MKFEGRIRKTYKITLKEEVKRKDSHKLGLTVTSSLSTEISGHPSTSEVLTGTPSTKSLSKTHEVPVLEGSDWVFLVKDTCNNKPQHLW